MGSTDLIISNNLIILLDLNYTLVGNSADIKYIRPYQNKILSNLLMRISIDDFWLNVVPKKNDQPPFAKDKLLKKHFPKIGKPNTLLCNRK